MMPTRKDVSRGRLLEPAQRIEQLFQVLVVALHAGVEILRGPVFRMRQDEPQGRWVTLRLIGSYLHGRDCCLVDRAGHPWVKQACAAVALRRSEKEASTTCPS